MTEIWSPYFAGILYMWNPFVYDRFLDGQYLVLAGYALLPWFTLALFQFLDRPSFRTTLYIALLACFISILSIHSVFFIFLITLVSCIVVILNEVKNLAVDRQEVLREAKDDRKKYLLNLTKWSAIGLVTIFLASSYWLIPLLQGQGTTSQQISTFDNRQLLTFQTVADHTYGIPASLNPLTLYGYWGEDQGRFTLPKEHMPVWGLIFIFIFVLAAIGVVGYWKRNDAKFKHLQSPKHSSGVILSESEGSPRDSSALPQNDKQGKGVVNHPVIVFATLTILAWIFAVGIADPPFSYINGWMLAHVPLFSGFREPQKFIGLIALGYAILGALGLHYLLTKTNSWRDETLQTLHPILVALALFLPILYTPTMVLGFAGQLRSADYPADWYTTNQKLNADPTNFQVLFLPWHHYIDLSFAGRVVANPADRFFDKPVIVSTSDELGIIPSNTETSNTTFVEKEILADHQNLGAKLTNRHIKYVILAKEGDYQDYNWLNKSPDLKLIRDNKTLKIYQNLKY